VTAAKAVTAAVFGELGVLAIFKGSCAQIASYTLRRSRVVLDRHYFTPIMLMVRFIPA